MWWATVSFFSIAIVALFVLASSITQDPEPVAQNIERVAVEMLVLEVSTTTASENAKAEEVPEEARKTKEPETPMLMVAEEMASEPEKETTRDELKSAVNVNRSTEGETVGNEEEVLRIKSPYPFAPFSGDVLNTASRVALVNIACTVENGASQAVTGSGMFIDPRGVVITNAHIGQYVLLSEVSSGIKCVGRSGAPAQDKWNLRIMYMPEKWVSEHAKDLRVSQPMGTGEHDYAILLADPLSSDAPRVPFPYVPLDVREAVAFQGDTVLLAGYPAGFIGAFIAQNNLYPATTFTVIGRMFTFQESAVSIDLFSLGGVILAQGGSSGGAVMNAWGRLVGIIVTTSDGKTTSERDLRAISLSHVDRSMHAHEGIGLTEFLDGNVEVRANSFRTNKLGALAQKLIDEIPQQ